MEIQWNVLYHLTLVILTVTVAASANSLLRAPSGPRNVKFVSLDIKSPESLEAEYISGQTSFNITSQVEREAPLSWREGGLDTYIVSSISMTVLGDLGKPTRTLSQLVLPGKYLRERNIPDMAERIIHSAKDMVKVIQTQGNIQVSDLVDIYDAIVQDLVPRLDIQRDFNQAGASVIYHKSIARTARRLANGIGPSKACPAHQAYQHAGLFACQQEYDQHAQRVKDSPLFRCHGPSCSSGLQKRVADVVGKESEGAGLQQAVEMAEGIYSMGNNTELAEEIARLIACGDPDCKEPGCNDWLYTHGWFIFGSDWGCCGDYKGCCYLATETCLVHDAICTCCSYPDFCLDPFCKPDPWCSNATTAAPPFW